MRRYEILIPIAMLMIVVVTGLIVLSLDSDTWHECQRVENHLVMPCTRVRTR